MDNLLFCVMIAAAMAVALWVAIHMVKTELKRRSELYERGIATKGLGWIIFAYTTLGVMACVGMLVSIIGACVCICGG